MKASAFAYERPGSIEEALAAKRKWGSAARFLAGGQSLLPAMNLRLNESECLIDLNRIEPLREIRVSDKSVVIGAMARHADVAASPLVRKHVPLLVEASAYLAHAAIRNRGTFGGSIALADPAAEWPAACLLLDAEIQVLGTAGRRTYPATGFFQGLYATRLGEDDLLESVAIPLQPAGERSAVLELSRRRGDYATAGVMARGKPLGGKLNSLGLVLFGVSDRPLRLAQFESRVQAAVNAGKLGELESLVKELLQPADLQADLYTSAEAKRHLCAVLTQRAVEQLLQPTKDEAR